MRAREAKEQIQILIENIERVIKGKTDTIKLTAIALLSRGQLLIEDVPGVGKTMLARALAKSIDASFKRIQFTPDLLPSDVTGVSVFNQKTSNFEFQPGPIFGNIVLIDEINRTTPRTQSSLLEAMEEMQITVDGQSYPLPDPFFVIATQNPIESYGTYPLPEGQRDRFLMAVGLGYPDFEHEKEIAQSQMLRHPIEDLKPVLSVDEVLRLQDAVHRVRVDESLIEYAVSLVQVTREQPEILLGASPRGSLALVRTSQATALMEGREFVLPDDIKRMAYWVLPHRFVTREHTRVDFRDESNLITTILEEVPVPVEAMRLGEDEELE